MGCMGGGKKPARKEPSVRMSKSEEEKKGKII